MTKDGGELVPQRNDLSRSNKTSFTESQKRLSVELNATAMNAKTVPPTELVTEFAEEFGTEPPEALRWAFRQWRRQSPYFPAISEIRELVDSWHREQRTAAAEVEQAQERQRMAEARAAGKLVSFPEVMEKLKDIAKMPEAPPATIRTVTRREVPPALQLTREQIEQRKEAERAEIERVRRRMEGA